MDPTLATVLGVLMRWVHIMCVVLLVGGVVYARGAGASISTSYSSKVTWLAAALFLSGLYNFLTKASYPPQYHMWFGIKFLFALHMLAMLLLLNRPSIGDFKRRRWMTGVVYSATVVIAISAVLRWLTMNPGAKLP
jgi:hypothetical protein